MKINDLSKYGYHVTDRNNLSSILMNGLVPQVGPRSSQISDAKGIYLFKSMDSLEDAMYNWLGDEFDEDAELVVLKVEIPEDATFSNSSADYEVTVTSPIPVSNIEVLDDQI